MSTGGFIQEDSSEIGWEEQSFLGTLLLLSDPSSSKSWVAWCLVCPPKHIVFPIETSTCEQISPCKYVCRGMKVKFIGLGFRRSHVPWPNGLGCLLKNPDLKLSLWKEVPKPKIMLQERLIQRFLFQQGLHIRFLLLKGFAVQCVSFDDGNITLLPGFYFMFVFPSASSSLQDSSWKRLITHPNLPVGQGKGWLCPWEQIFPRETLRQHSSWVPRP